jgi:eukaryotic-like serine/threonine-protein kinase
MSQQVAGSAGKPGVEDVLLGLEANTFANSGRLEKARELSRQAVTAAKLAGEKETAADYEAEAALREAVFGNAALSREGAAAALALSPGRGVRCRAALALAVAGDNARAQVLADDLGKQFPEDTLVQFNYMPMIRAQLAPNRKQIAKATEIFRARVPYELGVRRRSIPSTCAGKHIWLGTAPPTLLMTSRAS